MRKKIYHAPLGLVNLDSARQSKIDSEASDRRGPTPSGQGEEEDRFGEVAASPNLPNLTARGILLLLLMIFSIWPIARFCHHQTKGFCLSKIQENISCLSHPSVPFPEELRSVMKQKFFFFGRGLESFSFLSEDGTTVLKLFNNRYQRKLFWLRFTPFHKKMTYNRNKWKRSFTSYQIAYHTLRNETGLLYLHPLKSKDCPYVTLIDPLGIAHTIDLNQFGFALQKKGILAYPYFAKCVVEKDFAKAKEGFIALFSLLKKKMELGIADRDPLIRTNFGFFNDEAIQIDIGPFSHDPSLKDREKQKEKIEQITLSLRHWLECNYPNLLPYFYEALQNL